MSQALNELLFAIRQHAAFKELLDGPGAPEAKEYRPGADPTTQWAEHIYRSGRRQQDNAWRQFLIGDTSQQEKP
jgi:hypothetical protein